MIIGTAGHIDHGKTALVRCLTGIDTDRLPEEKRRGMTIDLGFAHMNLPGIGEVGVVDVPGHERFVRNMVAGATGIDLVLLVVAADDGVMPQTLEHLDIVLLLGIPRGVVALNKTDLVDAARVRAVTDDIHALLSGTPLADAPIVPVSAHTGAGIGALRDTLAEALREVRERPLPRVPAPAALVHPAHRTTAGFFRLPIDRVFVMPGFGPVVTGTVAAGELRQEAHVRLLPGGKEVRVRGIQAHGRAVAAATAGNRAALNLAGVDKDEIRRGMMAVDPRLTRAAHTLDVRVTLARHAGKIPRDHTRVRVHLGTAETLARLRWTAGVPVAGADAFAQLRLEAPLAALYGDRLILRSEEARDTLGGGVVLDPFAARRGATAPARCVRLARLNKLALADALSVWLEAHGANGWTLPALAEQVGQPPEQVAELLAARADVVQEEIAGKRWVAAAAAVDALVPRLATAVTEYLAAHPRLTAMPPATLHAQECARLDDQVFRKLLARLATAGIEPAADGLRPAGHRQRFSTQELRLAERIEALLAGAPPPRLAALAQSVGVPARRLAHFLGELERAGRVVKLANDLYLTRRELEAWRETAQALLARDGRLTLGEFRDAIGAGRELTLKVLEYFDRSGMTRRAGDARVAAAARAPVVPV